MIAARSDRDATRYSSRDFQQVGFHVDDLVLAMPFAGEEGLQAVGMELDGAVHEAIGRSQFPAMCVNQT